MSRLIKQRILIFSALTLFIVLFTPNMSFAGPGFGGDVNDIPIDGGASFLIIGAVAYGYKKLKKKDNLEADNNSEELKK